MMWLSMINATKSGKVKEKDTHSLTYKKRPKNLDETGFSGFFG